MKKYNVAIVGATGLVGREVLGLLHCRSFPMDAVRLFASPASAGKTVRFNDFDYWVEATRPGMFTGSDIAFFAVGASLSRELAIEACASGCMVIDKSSAFRMLDHVPLVIPEINAEAINPTDNIVASPNCSTTIMLMGLYPLHRRFRVKRLIVSTYQSMSGGGESLVDSWREQVLEYAEAEDGDRKPGDLSIFDNVRPRIGDIDESGYAEEEHKMIEETSKILCMPDLRMNTTCVRVPIERGHSVSIDAEFEQPVDIAGAHHAIEAFGKSVRLAHPDAKQYLGDYPIPTQTLEKEYCTVGRFRRSVVFENGLSFFVCGDNLWKGAAQNAVQIAELLIARKYV